MCNFGNKKLLLFRVKKLNARRSQLRKRRNTSVAPAVAVAVAVKAPLAMSPVIMSGDLR